MSNRLTPKLWEQFAFSAAGSLGEAVGKKLAEHVSDILQELRDLTTGDPAPSISALAVKSYLENSAFAQFNRRDVVAWALWKLAHMPPNQAEQIIGVAGVSAGGDVPRIIDGIIRYFAATEFGYRQLRCAR